MKSTREVFWGLASYAPPFLLILGVALCMETGLGVTWVPYLVAGAVLWWVSLLFCEIRRAR